MNLDQLMALTLSDDHAVQERTWFDAQPWDRTPVALRRRLTAGEVEAAGSALVRFVGIDRYEAAGGVVRRDLFDDEQSRFLSAPALLERLPVFPGLGVGLSPLVQWSVLPPLVIWLVRRQLTSTVAR